MNKTNYAMYNSHITDNKNNIDEKYTDNNYINTTKRGEIYKKNFKFIRKSESESVTWTHFINFYQNNTVITESFCKVLQYLMYIAKNVIRS